MGWSNPTWLNIDSFTAEQVNALLEDHIAKVVGRYRGRVFAWDVVNEAFDDSGVSVLKPSIWCDRPGLAWHGSRRPTSSRPSAGRTMLTPRRFSSITTVAPRPSTAKSDAIYAMVKDFKLRGVSIDGVGMQMHIFDLHADSEGISRNIARFTALGVQVHITEIDVALPLDATGHPSASDLARQADIYRAVASACLAHPGCSAIQTWGFTDKYSWIGWKTKGAKGKALLFDRYYEPKPAHAALEDACRQSSPAHATIPSP